MNFFVVSLVLATAVGAAVHPQKASLVTENAPSESLALIPKAISESDWIAPTVGSILVVVGALLLYSYLNREKEPTSDVESGTEGTKQADALTSEALTSQAEEMIEKAKEKFGSKLSADGDVVQILQAKAQGFGDRLRALVMNELNSAASSVGKALEADDCAAILDWDSNISANLPLLGMQMSHVGCFMSSVGFPTPPETHMEPEN